MIEASPRLALIFDWGGVLMRTVDYSPRHAWDRRLGLPPGSIEGVVHGIPAWQQAQRGEIDIEAYWQSVREELGLAAAELCNLRRDFYSGDRLDQSLVSFIRKLRRDGIQVGLLSNNTADLLDAITTLGICDLFDVCLVSARIGVMKPDSASYHAILDRMKITPSNAILIDDSPENVDGARAIGMQAIRFVPGMNLAARLCDLQGHR